MTASLRPATLAFDAHGIAYAPDFNDVYHSASGALGQAHHVFVQGTQAVKAWRARPSFTVLETGFGLGLNFLATWAAWRDDPNRCAGLYFVSLEKHPFARADLAQHYRRLSLDASLRRLADALLDAWPLLVTGLHRLEFDEGRVILTLALGDAAQVLPKLLLRADAIYLDGFAPAKNPELWSPAMFRALARVAAPRARCATYTVAGTVRRGLAEAGFECQKLPGFGGKRDMLSAVFAPQWRARRYEPPHAPAWPERQALVIGAGLAGCALTERLAARGWRISLLERHDTPAAEASGNPAGVFHPLLARADNPAARLTRAGFLHALARWRSLAQAGYAPHWHAHGLLQVVHSASDADALLEALAVLGYPPELARPVSASEAARYAGMAGGVPPFPACFFAGGGALDPSSLCRAQLAYASDRLTRVFGRAVADLHYADGYWHARAGDGALLAGAPVAILANAHKASQLARLAHAPTRSVRGQVSLLPRDSLPGLRVPLIGAGYVAPLSGACALTGATYDIDDDDPCVRLDSQQENLARLRALVAGQADHLEAGALGDRVAFRCVTSDRLPLVGALANEAAARDAATSFKGAQLRDLPRQPGLYGAFAYGSRGLVWASLCAELLAAQLNGEPWPIERDLADAIDPARFLLRALRRGSVI